MHQEQSSMDSGTTLSDLPLDQHIPGNTEAICFVTMMLVPAPDSLRTAPVVDSDPLDGDATAACTKTIWVQRKV